MDYQVRLSASARRDLEDIVRYIALDAPGRALEFGQLLIDSTKKLGQFPQLGRVVPEFARADLREIVVRGYRVIDKVSPGSNRIDVLRFWQGSRGAPIVSS